MKPDYTNKNVAVLGAGRSGKAAALLLAEEGAKVTMLDSAPEEKLAGLEPLRAKGVYLLCGPAAEEDPTVYDLGVSAPGSIRSCRLAETFRARTFPTIGELELGWQFCRVPVIGITGTNGKTTTTELISQMLNACGQRTVACGNIGKPLVEAARENDDLAVLTVEVSSFQLETIREFPSRDQRLAQLRARPSRSLSLDPRIPGSQAAHFRKPNRGRHRGNQRLGKSEGVASRASLLSAPGRTTVTFR